MRSVVIGKFMPLHKGHEFLLREAQKDCDLTVIVCSLLREPIPGEERFIWMKETFPNARVFHLDDETMPHYPEDDPEHFWDRWRETIKRFHPEKIDYIYSSENYGETLAKEFDCKFVCVDLDRKTFPISGTDVRNEPIKNWDFISDAAKPYFCKKILMTGAESCGKSTLTENLAKHYQTIFTPEYAREYLKEKLLNFDLDDLNRIAIEQFTLQMKDVRKANKIYFSDTSALETHLYGMAYLKESSSIIKQVLMLQSDWFDCALLLTPDVPWVQDNTRNMEHGREDFHEKAKKLLEDMKIPYYIISGSDFEDRTRQAIEVCDKVLTQPMKVTK